MKILFVFRNHQKGKIDPIIQNQAKSLIEQGININYFPVEAGGLAYIKLFFDLKKHLKNKSYDLVHAHYGYTAFIVGLANPGLTIVSLMGSDVLKGNKLILFLIRIFSRYFWSKTIVKSAEMERFVPGSTVIPNGVNINIFSFKGKNESISKVGFSQKNNIIFVATTPQSDVKNLILAKRAIQYLDDDTIDFHVISDISIDRLPYYYSAADVLLLTSISEGSPNVIKEAMACNCPIVSTNVGDVEKIINNTAGCFITSFNYIDVAEKIKLALEFAKAIGRTEGLNRILKLELDSENCSVKLKKLYSETLSIIK